MLLSLFMNYCYLNTDKWIIGPLTFLLLFLITFTSKHYNKFKHISAGANVHYTSKSGTEC